MTIQGLHFGPLDAAATHCVLDGARVGREIERVIALAPESTSLYRGKSAETLRNVAPYLLRFEPGSMLMKNYFARGWGNSWGVLLGTRATLAMIQGHLRQFLIVQDEAGRSLYFRFYDPRVLRIFLPTCSRPQLKQLFGPIDRMIVEDEDPHRALVFHLDRGNLVRTVVDLSQDGGKQIIPAIRQPAPGAVEDSLIV